jgi:probable selenium-dependent hydroxylase accessory protein YqeC
MWHFQRIDPVQSIVPLKFVAFVGAGGKTSLIDYLAANLTRRGKTVAITTTTKIFAREPYQLLNNEGTLLQRNIPMIRVGKTLEDGKLTAVDPEDIQRLGTLYDTVLIEADGAKGKPLKFPAPYEPVIPSVAEKIYVVAGLDALFQKMNDVVFRWELFHDSVGIDDETVITPDVFLSFFSESILLKGIGTKQCAVVLNKYDTLRQKSYGNNIARELSSNIKGISVIITSVNTCTFYKVNHTNDLQKNDLRFYNKNT